MQHKSFDSMPCPIARSLERVGEWWSRLILRDALHGFTRFDQFQKSIGIAPNILRRRLNAWVKAGRLDRRRYSERPPRDVYVATARGRDFQLVLVALLAWGNKHFAPEGASVQVINTRTGAAVEPILVDPATGRPIQKPDYAFAPGPAAPERTRRRYAAVAETAAQPAPAKAGARRRSAP